MGQLDFLVTGARGQLGRAVTQAAQARGMRAFGVGSADMPLEHRAGIFATLLTHRPRWVVHCAAITNVDGCEGDPLAAYRVNALGTSWLAEAAASVDAGIVYISTDFVFDGTAAGQPYAVDAATRPLSVYGASKRLGEEAVLAVGKPDFHVMRTSWVFGPGGANFPRAILNRARSGQPLKVVTDQIGRPTSTLDLAEAVLDLCALRPNGGIWHAANEGSCSWRQFAIDVLREAGLGDIAVGEQLAKDLARPAARPAWSVLDTSMLTALRGRPLPHYTDAVRRYLAAEAAMADTTRPASRAEPGPASGGPLRGKEYRS